MPRIIFVTNLTLWSLGQGHGGPAFTKTVERYLAEGWEVYLVSDEPSNAGYPKLDETHNLCLRPSWFRKRLNAPKIGLLFRYLDQWVACIRFQKVLDRLLRGVTDHTVLYAYEFGRFLPAKRCAQKHGVPLVTRFQGTTLSGIKRHTVSSRIRRFPAYEATAYPSDLVIMTNDGTCGDQVLQQLHNIAPTLFLYNGLDLMERDLAAMRAGFDRAGFRQQLGVNEDEILILTVSRLTGWKKVERTIDGLKACLPTVPRCKLVIVGDGDARPMLEARAQDLGIADHVIFAGAVPHDAVYDYMMACDIFSSLYDLSNVGNPLLEAMALGSCIVTLDVGDTKRLIENRENGILMTYDTLEQLGDIFAELAGDAALRQRLGKAAADYAKEHFWSWQARMELETQNVRSLACKKPDSAE